MEEKSIRASERRERLVAQIGAQRMALAQNIEPWRMPLARVDQALAGLRYLRRHPVWIVGGAALLAALRPGRVGKWLGRGWVAWQMLQNWPGNKGLNCRKERAARACRPPQSTVTSPEAGDGNDAQTGFLMK